MRLIFTIFLFLSFSITKAQNLVPNPGFEEFVLCPTNIGQVTNHCKNWYQYTTGTTDYYNSCSSGAAGVPLSQSGFQYPAEGDAYAGFLTAFGGGDYKEYLTVKIPALVIGGMYEVSMSLSLAESANYTTNDIGVFFFSEGPDSIKSTKQVLPVHPQISYKKYGHIADTTHWIRVVDTLIADSAYSNLLIGGYDHVDTLDLRPTNFDVFKDGSAYYFVDSVVVVRIDTSNVTGNLIRTRACIGDTISYPYTAAGFDFQPDNVFILQLSDASGNFDKGIVIGTINATRSATLNATIPLGIPEGDNYRMRIVATNPPDTTEAHTISLKEDCYLLDVPTAFSPNGDGNNDILFARGSNVTEVNLRIYNRWGQLIFETNDINKGWDGTVNGRRQDIDVYGYVLSGAFRNGRTMHKQGNISITQ